MIKALKNKKAEGYIDVAVAVLVIAFILVNGSEAKWLLSSPKNLDITRVFGSRNLKKSTKNAR